MKAFTVEWVNPTFLCTRNVMKEQHGVDVMIPVVRLADVDNVLTEAVWAMEIFQSKYFSAPCCCVGLEQYDRAQAFLASPLVAAWRERQEQNGKKEQEYSRAEFENDQMGQTGTDLSRKEPS